MKIKNITIDGRQIVWKQTIVRRKGIEVMKHKITMPGDGAIYSGLNEDEANATWQHALASTSEAIIFRRESLLQQKS